jgi:hypothetical protein
MKFQVLVADQKTVNGRVYPQSVIEAAIRRAEVRIKERKFTVHSETPPTLNNCLGIVNKFEMKGPRLMADIEWLPHMLANQVKSQASSHQVVWSPDGFGQVAEDGKVSDYEMIALIAAPRSTKRERQSDQGPAS